MALGAFSKSGGFMFILLLLLWFVFNGRFTLEVLLVGLAVSFAVYVFICVFMGYSPGKDLKFFSHFPKAIRYLFTLVAEIFKANFAVIRYIFDPRIEIEPVMIWFRHDFKDRDHNVILANSITLTPGTITVETNDDCLLVHSLDKDLIKDIDKSVFIKQLDAIEKPLKRRRKAGR